MCKLSAHSDECACLSWGRVYYLFILRRCVWVCVSVCVLRTDRTHSDNNGVWRSFAAAAAAPCLRLRPGNLIRHVHERRSCGMQAHAIAHGQHGVIHIECPFRAPIQPTDRAAVKLILACTRVWLLQQLSFGGNAHTHTHSCAYR